MRREGGAIGMHLTDTKKDAKDGRFLVVIHQIVTGKAAA
jgi:hypothetical protein